MNAMFYNVLANEGGIPIWGKILTEQKMNMKVLFLIHYEHAINKTRKSCAVSLSNACTYQMALRLGVI